MLGGRPLIHPSCWELRAPAVMETASMETGSRGSQRSSGAPTRALRPCVFFVLTSLPVLRSSMAWGWDGREKSSAEVRGSWHVKEGEFQGPERWRSGQGVRLARC